MMGHSGCDQNRLFYSFNFEHFIPANHLLRGIDQFFGLGSPPCVACSRRTRPFGAVYELLLQQSHRGPSDATARHRKGLGSGIRWQ